MSSKKLLATSKAVSSTLHVKKWTRLDSWSTLLMIASNLCDFFGSLKIKYDYIDPHLRSGAPRSWGSVIIFWFMSLFCWHTRYPAQYLLTSLIFFSSGSHREVPKSWRKRSDLILSNRVPSVAFLLHNILVRKPASCTKVNYYTS